jgi:hypothetical protein
VAHTIHGDGGRGGRTVTFLIFQERQDMW